MSGRLLLGAIADDYTGGSDMAGMLASQGVRTVQAFGVPDEHVLDAARNAEAVVVSLKTRSVPAEQAVSKSLDALAQLRKLQPDQVQFKYCSTFDSTRAGNIGPVTAALMDALMTDLTIAVPALPVNGRTQYMGYLFVNGVLLSESPMRDHPLNPMTEPNLVRHLQAQTDRKVGLIDLAAVRGGSVRKAMDRLREEGVKIALVDALEESDLRSIAAEAAGLSFITGGSGISRALPGVWQELGRWRPGRGESAVRKVRRDRTLILAGSCSAATLRQIELYKHSGSPSVPVAVKDLLADREKELGKLEDFCRDAWRSDERVLVYSSADASRRNESGPDVAAAIESAFGELAVRLSDGLGRLVVAGGETSGAVVEALGVRAVRIGAEIDPGVPGLESISGPPLALALKSGNFGAPDFFVRAPNALGVI